MWGAVAVAGTAIVVLGGDGGGANSVRGDLLAVGALFAWTAYFVCTKIGPAARSRAFEFLTGMAIVAAVAVVPLPAARRRHASGRPTPSGWITIVYIAVVNGLLGHFLMALRPRPRQPPHRLAAHAGDPGVLGGRARRCCIDEPLTGVQVVGMAVVLGALGAGVAERPPAGAPSCVEADVEAIESLPDPVSRSVRRRAAGPSAITSRYQRALAFGRAGQRVVVHVHDPEPVAVALGPLEVVEQRPHEEAAEVDALVDRLARRRGGGRPATAPAPSSCTSPSAPRSSSNAAPVSWTYRGGGWWLRVTATSASRRPSGSIAQPPSVTGPGGVTSWTSGEPGHWAAGPLAEAPGS